MAIKAVTIKVTTGDNKPLEELQRLIRMRADALKETTRDACIATAINILTSVKAATRKAPTKQVPHQAVRIEATNLYGGFYTDGGLRKVCARNGSNKGKKSDIQPALGFSAAGSKASVLNARVYACIPFNERMTFAKNRNFPNRCWYVLAQSMEQAQNYALRRIGRMLSKESGMAKYACGVAQAKISTRPGTIIKPTGAKSWKIAQEAASIRYTGHGVDSGDFGIEFHDKLDYSLAALKGGASALELAIKKAANKTAGLIHLKYVNKKFDEDVETPFPEVKRPV